MPSKEYMREYRQTENGQAALTKQKQRDKARRRALAALAARHQAEFEVLLSSHLAEIEREENDQ